MSCICSGRPPSISWSEAAALSSGVVGDDQWVTSPQTVVTPLTVPALLAERVRASGQDTYVITPDGGLTYQDAEARSADIARRLLAAGIGKGSRVGLFFPNGIDWISWWLALSRIGALVAVHES